MSGFEIAGVVLAVFPIVVDGLEHYIQGVQTIKDWRRYRIKVKDYAGIMESARVFYLDTLDELLDGIVQSEGEMAVLMEKPGGTPWQRPLYEEQLKQRLGRSYDSYFRTLKIMINSLTRMCEELGVSSSGKVRNLASEISLNKTKVARIGPLGRLLYD